MRKLIGIFGLVLLSSFYLLQACGGNAENLKVGDPAPNFTLEDAFNNKYTLSDYKGKNPVVVYFYPKAGTAGCTTEACGIRDEWSKFKKDGIVVLGISVDSKESIKKFIDENDLNFPLLSDESKNVCRTYGVLNNLGVASRISFVIDKNGNIADIIRDVNVSTHADDVYKLAEKLK